MNRTHFKRATALTLVVTLVLCQGFVTGMPLRQVVSKVQRYVSGAGNVVATRSAAKLPRAAHLSVQGTVTLNGHAVPTGATVFSGGDVKTAANSIAVLSFGAMGQVELASTSDFMLALEGTTLGGQLRAGSATIVAPAGVAVKIVTADGPVVADGREATNLTIDVTAGKTRVGPSGSRAEATAAAGVEGATDAPAVATTSLRWRGGFAVAGAVLGGMALGAGLGNRSNSPLANATPTPTPVLSGTR